MVTSWPSPGPPDARQPGACGKARDQASWLGREGVPERAIPALAKRGPRGTRQSLAPTGRDWRRGTNAHHVQTEWAGPPPADPGPTAKGRRARADDRGDGLDDPRSPPKEALRQYCDGVMSSSSRASAHAPATAASAARAGLSASVKLATHNGVQWDRAKARLRQPALSVLNQGARPCARRTVRRDAIAGELAQLRELHRSGGGGLRTTRGVPAGRVKGTLGVRPLKEEEQARRNHRRGRERCRSGR